MHRKKISPVWARIITPLFILLLTAATPILTQASGALTAFQASAQTVDAQKVQAAQLLQLGIRQHKSGQFTAALQSVQQALAIYKKLGDDRNAANSLLALGNTYFSLGQYRQAVKFYQQSLEIRQTIRDRQGEVEVLVGLSNAYLNLGQEQDAKKAEQLATAIRREIGDPRGQAAFLNNLGVASESQKLSAQAIKFHQQQLKIAREIGDRNLEVESLQKLAQAYESLGQYQQAIDLHQQQLEIAKKSNDSALEANALNQLATDYKSLGILPQAIESYQQQLEIAKHTGNQILAENAVNQLAQTYQSHEQYQKAIELYQQQLETAKQSNDALAEGTALNNLALAFLKSNDPKQAQGTLVNALKAWDTIRAKLGSNDNYIAQQATTYRLLQQSLIAQNQPEAALEMAEQGRVKAIVELLGLRLSSESVGTGLKAAPPQIALPNISAIKQIAKTHNATLVEYSIISDQELYAWVIQPRGDIAFRRIDIKEQKTDYPVSSLADVVTSSLESISVKEKSGIAATEPTNKALPAKPLLQLHQVLIKPIEDLLPKNPTAHVIFIPEKELFFVPFAALADITGNALIEKHTILTSPAIQVLALTKQQRQNVTGNKALVVGNPTMPSITAAIGEPPQSLPPLLGAEQEALEIAQLLKTQALVGNKATKSAFLQQLPKARIIHLATYAILNERQQQGVPGTSAEGSIALTPSGSDNGILTASELLNLYGQPQKSPLRAELVVLSAGNTGRGKITGNGFIGLSVSLISAGVPSVIMPLGSASDDATTFLLTKFYQQLKRTGDKAQALRQAMLTTMKQYPNSQLWAAFILVGEAQ